MRKSILTFIIIFMTFFSDMNAGGGSSVLCDRGMDDREDHFGMVIPPSQSPPPQDSSENVSLNFENMILSENSITESRPTTPTPENKILFKDVVSKLRNPKNREMNNHEAFNSATLLRYASQAESTINSFNLKRDIAASYESFCRLYEVSKDKEAHKEKYTQDSLQAIILLRENPLTRDSMKKTGDLNDQLSNPNLNQDELDQLANQYANRYARWKTHMVDFSKKTN